MFAKKYKFLFCYLIVVAGLMFVVAYLFNPQSLSIKKHSFVNPHPEPQFFTFSKIEEKPQIKQIWQFRENQKRHNFKEVFFNPDELQDLKEAPGSPVNFGAHSASKSTPMQTLNYVVAAGDYGLIQVFNKQTMKPHWKIELFDSETGIHSNPIGFDDFIFIGDYSGRFYFLNLKEKKLVWSIDLGDGIGATPLFDGQHLYVNVELSYPANGYIIKIDPFKQKILWRSRLIGQQSHSSPAFNDEALFFGDNDGDFYSLSKETGKVLWRRHPGKAVKSAPSLYKNSVVFSSWNKFLYSYDQKTGELLWTFPLSNYNQSSMAVWEEKGVGVLNSGTGIHKIDLNTGKELGFIELNMSKLARKASPKILKYQDKHRVLTSCVSKKLCIVDLSSFKVVKMLPLPYGFSNEVGVFDANVVVSTDEGPKLYYYDTTRL